MHKQQQARTKAVLPAAFLFLQFVNQSLFQAVGRNAVVLHIAAYFCSDSLQGIGGVARDCIHRKLQDTTKTEKQEVTP